MLNYELHWTTIVCKLREHRVQHCINTFPLAVIGRLLSQKHVNDKQVVKLKICYVSSKTDFADNLLYSTSNRLSVLDVGNC